MTMIIPFLPSNMRPPTFTATLDGVNHKIILTWNISAQRYYVNVYDDSGAWVVTVPLITTPPARKISSVSYDPFKNLVNVQLTDPTTWPIPLPPGGLITKPGTIIQYTLEN